MGKKEKHKKQKGEDWDDHENAASSPIEEYGKKEKTKKGHKKDKKAHHSFDNTEDSGCVQQQQHSSQDAQTIEDGSVKGQEEVSNEYFEKAQDIDKEIQNDEFDGQKKDEVENIEEALAEIQDDPGVGCQQEAQGYLSQLEDVNDESGGVLDEAKDFEKDKHDLLYADSQNNGFDEGSAVVEENIEVGHDDQQINGAPLPSADFNDDNSLIEVVQEDNEDDLLPPDNQDVEEFEGKNRAEGDFEELIQDKVIQLDCQDDDNVDKISTKTRICTEEDQGDDFDKFSSGTRVLVEQDLGFTDFAQNDVFDQDFAVSEGNLVGLQDQQEFHGGLLPSGDANDDNAIVKTIQEENEDDLIQPIEQDVEEPEDKNCAMEDFPREIQESVSSNEVIEKAKDIGQEVQNDDSNAFDPLKEDEVEDIKEPLTEIQDDPVVEGHQDNQSDVPRTEDVNNGSGDVLADAKEIENDKDDLLQYEAQNGGLKEGLAAFGEDTEEIHNEQEIQEELIQPNSQDAEVVVVKKISYVVENASGDLVRKVSSDDTVVSKADVSIGSPGAKLKRDWREENLSKLTVVRSALRQRGNIKSLVSKFESLAENPEETSVSPNVSNISPKNVSPFVKTSPRNYTPKKQSLVDEYEHSPVGRSTMRSSSSKAIDQMFDFVEKAEMLSPKSTIAIRSTSAPRRPVASSTPFAMSQSVERLSRDLVAEKEEMIFREKSKALLKDIEMLKEQIARAVEAIAVCQKKHDFNGTLQELNAQRMLLVASERKLLLTQEMNKLKEVHTLKLTSAGKGWVKMPEVENRGCCTMDITSINIRLDRTFYIKTADEDSSFVFVVIAKCGGQLYATQLLDVMDMGTMRSSIVQVRESIRFEQLPVDFVASIEIFAIKTVHRQTSRTSAASKIASKAKAFLVGKPKTSDSDQESLASSTSDFFRCGIVHLNRESVGKQHFSLLDQQYPLDGSIELRAAYMFGRKNSIGSVEHL